MSPNSLGPVGVLMGGPSSEREVSLQSGEGVVAALEKKGYEVVPLEWRSGGDLCELLRRQKLGAVWIALHGTPGEDGAVQGLLECLAIPYTGANVCASAVAMDKAKTKVLLQAAGVPVPRWFLDVSSDDVLSRALREFGFPFVVKPACEGSSVGVTIVKEASEMEAALALARRYHGLTIIEEYVPGAEVVVGVLAGKAIGTLEIRPKSAFYDYEAKYLRDDTEYLCPAPIPDSVRLELQDAALLAHDTIGCGAYSRVDFRLAPDGTPRCLEINTLPGMTSHSLLPKIAAHAGLSYADLVERILLSARLHA